LTLNLTKEFKSQLDQRLQPITAKLDKLATNPTNITTSNLQPQNNTTIQQQLEVLFTKVDQLSNKVEEIQKQLQLTPQPISVQKLNLQEATEKEFKQKLSYKNVKTNQTKAAWNAIQKCKASDEGLTWINLYQLATSKDKKLKVSGFAKETYKKLEEIGYIPE